MKIGIDIRLIGKKRTGDEVVFFNLVKNLALLDVDYEFELLTSETDESVLAQIARRLEIENKKNFKIVSLGKAGKFKWNFWTLPRYLHKNPVDIFQTQYITPFFISKKIKIVTIIHDISFNFFPQLIKFSDLFFLRILIPLSLKRADKIVAVSEFTKNEIEKFYHTPSEKVSVVLNSVGDEISNWDFDEMSIAKAQEKYKTSDEYILYLGALQPRKNIPMLIEAFMNLEGKSKSMKLVLAGGKNAHNFDKKIEEMVRKLKAENSVVFTGYVEDAEKMALISGAKLFVFPSLYEGFGIPVLEAFAAGVPVVCSDIPSLREVGADVPEYFDPKSVGSLTQAMYNVISSRDLAAEMVRKGSQRLAVFSWENAAKTTVAIYQMLVHNKKD